MRYPYRYLPIISSIHRSVKRFVANQIYAGNNVWCPVCLRSFKSWLNKQEHGSCPYCQSLTRQRMVCLYLASKYNPDQFPVKLLYFAPDWGLEKWFRQQNHKFHCVTADLAAPNVDFYVDITNLPFDSQSFDLIVCSHVLEHVLNDAKAINEMFRVLCAGGTALIQVPYNRFAEYTDEDPSVTNPSERRKRFGQFDHLRLYGLDIIERLTFPGFNVETVNPAQICTVETNRLGLWNDTIFICSKE